MLVLTRKSGESIIINDEIEIKIIDILGDKIKIGIEAPPSMRILRSELRQIAESNKQAASQGVTKEILSLISKLGKEQETGVQAKSWTSEGSAEGNAIGHL